jgi:hypothetical protein
MFGLFLLTVSLSVGSCQAFIHSLPHMDGTTPADQRDIQNRDTQNRDVQKSARHDLHGNV